MRLILIFFICLQVAPANSSPVLDGNALTAFRNRTGPLFTSAKAKAADRLWQEGKNLECARTFKELSTFAQKQELRDAALFRAGRCFERAHSYRDARKVYEHLQSHKTLGPLVKLRLAVVYHELGASEKAIKLLVSLALREDPALARRARAFHARVLEAAGQQQNLVDQFAHSKEREIRFKVAMARAHLGDRSGAIASLRALYVGAPTSAIGRDARSKLAQMDPNCFAENFKEPPCLEPREYLIMAKAFFRAHASKKLVAFLGPKLKSPNFADRVVRCEALWLVARSYDKLRKRGPGQSLYDEANRICGGHEREPDLLYFGGVSAYREDRDKVALKHFSSLHKLYPDHSYNDDAILYEAQILKESGKVRQAERTLQQGIKRYPDGDMNVELRWRYVWYALSEGKTWTALKRIRAMKKNMPEVTSSLKRGRLAYWEARLLERRGKKKKARLLYRRLMRNAPMTYHALMAFTRLKKLVGSRRAKQYLRSALAPPSANRSDGTARSNLDLPSVLERIGFLIRMGLLAEAQKELAVVQSKVDAKALLLLADLADRSGEYLIAVRMMKRVLSEHPRLKLNDETRPFWELAYPRAYRKLVMGHAKAAGVDPYVVWSIMRTESGFNARIESWANAIGLMQLIMPTAKRMAKVGQRVRVTEETLRQPETNVRLGVRYLKHLQDRYPHIVTVAAGYNAGGGRIKGWLKKRGRMNLDLFVAHIPFRQTRHYAMRVLESWFRYHLLYEKDVPALAFRLPRVRRP